MSQPTEPEDLAAQLKLLAEGRLSQGEAHHVLHELGRQHVTEAEPVVRNYLYSDDADLRALAIEVLLQHWRMGKYEDVATNMLFNDPESHCRLHAASALGASRRNSRDVGTLRTLANAVRHDDNDTVREAAYAAMKSVLQYDPQEQFRMAARGVASVGGINWSVVDRYSSGWQRQQDTKLAE